ERGECRLRWKYEVIPIAPMSWGLCGNNRPSAVLHRKSQILLLGEGVMPCLSPGYFHLLVICHCRWRSKRRAIPSALFEERRDSTTRTVVKKNSIACTMRRHALNKHRSFHLC